MLTLFEILSLTTLVSVGFSSWVIVENTNQSVNAGVSVETVVNNNNYLSIKNVMFSEYVFVDGNSSSSGFYNNNSYTAVENVAILSYEVVLSSYQILASTSNVIFDISLGYSGTVSSALDIINKSSHSLKINDNDVEISSMPNQEPITFTYSQSYTSNSTISLVCEHSFTFSSALNKYNFIKELASKQGLPLIITASVKG